ncbi:hypothetical protein BHM03_00021506, partial [Ensete ventricosum]
GVCFLWRPPLPRSDVCRAIIGSPAATARSLVVLFLWKRFFHLGSSFVGLRASPAFLRLAAVGAACRIGADRAMRSMARWAGVCVYDRSSWCSVCASSAYVDAGNKNYGGKLTGFL